METPPSISLCDLSFQAATTTQLQLTPPLASRSPNALSLFGCVPPSPSNF